VAQCDRSLDFVRRNEAWIDVGGGLFTRSGLWKAWFETGAAATHTRLGSRRHDEGLHREYAAGTDDPSSLVFVEWLGEGDNRCNEYVLAKAVDLTLT
jgi:hypothetical protein